MAYVLQDKSPSFTRNKTAMANHVVPNPLIILVVVMLRLIIYCQKKFKIFFRHAEAKQ